MVIQNFNQSRIYVQSDLTPAGSFTVTQNVDGMKEEDINRVVLSLRSWSVQDAVQEEGTEASSATDDDDEDDGSLAGDVSRRS